MTELCEGYAGIRATREPALRSRIETEASCVDCDRTWWVGPGEPGLPECYECGACGISTGRCRATIGGTP